MVLVLQVDDLFETDIDNLLYNRNYTVMVTSVLNDGDFYVESEPMMFTFETPRCLDMIGFTLDECGKLTFHYLLFKLTLVCLRTQTF